MIEPIVWIELIALAILLVRVAMIDLAHRRISNRLCLTIALLALPYWLAADPRLGRLVLQLLSALVVGMIFLAVFARALVGGGDVKLMAALALWFPPPALIDTILLTAIVGGVLGVAVLVRNRRRLSKHSVPYGVAIASAGLIEIALRIGDSLSAFARTSI